MPSLVFLFRRIDKKAFGIVLFSRSLVGERIVPVFLQIKPIQIFKIMLFNIILWVGVHIKLDTGSAGGT